MMHKKQIPASAVPRLTADAAVKVHTCVLLRSVHV